MVQPYNFTSDFIYSIKKKMNKYYICYFILSYNMSQPQIGIIGGSFSPPHLGHLMLGIYALHIFKLDQIWYVPSFVHPEKSKHQYTYSERCEMLKMMLSHHHSLKLSTIESEMDCEINYTYLVFTHLFKKYPDYNFSLIIGDDLAESIKKWHYYQNLQELTDIHIIPREFCVSSISSTQVREMIASGNKWDQLKSFVDPKVLELLMKIDSQPKKDKILI